MIETINEVKKGAEDNSLSFLDMRIGIHTGKVVAGIIGSKLVRYDIFGVGVLIANKMESNGLAGAVCISEDTLLTLLKQPEVANEFYIKFNQEVSIPSVGRKIK
jgi:class 3 adenylate cyclase